MPPNFGPGPAGSTGGPAGSIGPKPLGSSFVPPGGVLPPGLSATPTATPPADNPNLVEVTIYGIASLYEKPRE